MSRTGTVVQGPLPQPCLVERRENLLVAVMSLHKAQGRRNRSAGSPGSGVKAKWVGAQIRLSGDACIPPCLLPPWACHLLWNSPHVSPRPDVPPLPPPQKGRVVVSRVGLPGNLGDPSELPPPDPQTGPAGCQVSPIWEPSEERAILASALSPDFGARWSWA